MGTRENTSFWEHTRTPAHAAGWGWRTSHCRQSSARKVIISSKDAFLYTFPVQSLSFFFVFLSYPCCSNVRVCIFYSFPLVSRFPWKEKRSCCLISSWHSPGNKPLHQRTQYHPACQYWRGTQALGFCGPYAVEETEKENLRKMILKLREKIGSPTTLKRIYRTRQSYAGVW